LAEQISTEDRVLLQAVARVILTDGRGPLEGQLTRRGPTEPPVPRLAPARSARAEPDGSSEPSQRDLVFFNGIGGFTRDGREYVITTSPGRRSPAPWVNVLANPHFGTVVSESGPAYTWSENAHEARLTPWSNDPVSDPAGETFYLRDEESGQIWCPTPLPIPSGAPHVTRHGFGYTVFEHTLFGIRSELVTYVAIDAPVKFWRCRIRNDSGRPRRLSVTGYVEWVLGDLRSKAAMHVVTELDPVTGAILARNAFGEAFAGKIAFFAVDSPVQTVTGDRTEFIGRNRSLENPAALRRTRLSDRVGAVLDPCAAIQAPLELAPGEERELTFTMGVGRSADQAHGLVQQFAAPGAANLALEAVWRHWTEILGAVQLDTGDASLDLLANGWLVYQTTACRLWGRSGFYQSGGAFGFRDQLQDTMALVHTQPALLREHLLRAAGRQFPEGDVQHWWHPPSGRGVRTHCSDDFLWLPLAAARYVRATGDHGVLDELAPFVEGRDLSAEEDSYYDLPTRSDETATLYDHCARAIRHALERGEHGLPLIGTGDWNDGMNLVGHQGRGESVWLGFFLHQVVEDFGGIATERGDAAFARLCTDVAIRLRASLELAWDGGWYRRAYFDDGTPLGSAANQECRIDAISQSWAVLSGAADPDRCRMAMAAVDQHLVRSEDGIIKLLDPPFDRSELDPGYIKGYVPGVRENGGQYTHAAIWTVMAFAALGDGRRAWELLRLINPVNHGRDPATVERYRVEPYVIAADVYGAAPHVGRGGWTWYTGSAGWFYRLIVESFVGLRREPEALRFEPCLPPDWAGFKVRYRYGSTYYQIQLRPGPAESGVAVVVDGAAQPEPRLPLVDDRREHVVEVRIAAVAASATPATIPSR
jgi:cellobiose phosphorylase